MEEVNKFDMCSSSLIGRQKSVCTHKLASTCVSHATQTGQGYYRICTHQRGLALSHRWQNPGVCKSTAAPPCTRSASLRGAMQQSSELN
jgi:hypothetical protein